MVKLKTHMAYSLVEVLISLAVLGVLVGLSLQLVRPSNSVSQSSRKVGQYVEHLAMSYRRIYAQYGVTPLNADINSDGSLDSIPLYIRNYDAKASYSAASPSYLDYPSDFRVYLKPEEFPFLSAGLGLLNGAGHVNREFLLLDVHPESRPGSLNDRDLVLIGVDDPTGRVLSAYEMAVEHSLNTTTLPKSFYDTFRGL
jgi:type II secretory pathway pseudopilin PulG